MRRSVLALAIVLGVAFAFSAQAERVDWSEFMEERGAPPPSIGRGGGAKPEAFYDKTAVAKPEKKKGKKKAKKKAKGKSKRRAARKSPRR